MRGAIFYASKYGSTAQYARWIGEATNLPVFDVETTRANPAEFDFVVLGSPVIYYTLPIKTWVRRHMSALGALPVVLFTVSGASAGPKLDGWVANSLPGPLLDRLEHFALRGRMDRKELGWLDRIMLVIGGLMNPDRQAAREEFHGFDYMDRDSIGPVVARVQALKSRDAVRHLKALSS